MRMICEQILFASRVYEVPLQNISLSFTDIESFQKSYHRIPVTIPRIVGSAVWNELWNQEQDIFLYTSDAKFNTIPEAVIGRMAIDNIAIAHAKNNRMIVVDITNTGKHIHQGVDRFSRFKREEKDMKYNIQFYKRYKYYTSVMSNADFIFNNKTGLIELK